VRSAVVIASLSREMTGVTSVASATQPKLGRARAIVLSSFWSGKEGSQPIFRAAKPLKSHGRRVRIALFMVRCGRFSMPCPGIETAPKCFWMRRKTGGFRSHIFGANGGIKPGRRASGSTIFVTALPAMPRAYPRCCRCSASCSVMPRPYQERVTRNLMTGRFSTQRIRSGD